MSQTSGTKRNSRKAGSSSPVRKASGGVRNFESKYIYIYMGARIFFFFSVKIFCVGGCWCTPPSATAHNPACHNVYTLDYFTNYIYIFYIKVIAQCFVVIMCFIIVIVRWILTVMHFSCWFEQERHIHIYSKY